MMSYFLTRMSFSNSPSTVGGTQARVARLVSSQRVYGHAFGVVSAQQYVLLFKIPLNICSIVMGAITMLTYPEVSLHICLPHAWPIRFRSREGDHQLQRPGTAKLSLPVTSHVSFLYSCDIRSHQTGPSREKQHGSRTRGGSM